MDTATEIRIAINQMIRLAAFAPVATVVLVAVFALIGYLEACKWRRRREIRTAIRRRQPKW